MSNLTNDKQITALLVFNRAAKFSIFCWPFGEEFSLLTVWVN
jgi:hypothetical protein